MTITSLSIAEVVEIHRDQIERYGGAYGVRDLGLLRSAVAMPTSMFAGQFLHSDVCEMAAAYLFHLVKNHPFVDGNKRVGAVASVVFLAMNDHRMAAPEDDYADLVLAVARGKLAKSAIAEYFRAHTKPMARKQSKRSGKKRGPKSDPG